MGHGSLLERCHADAGALHTQLLQRLHHGGDRSAAVAAARDRTGLFDPGIALATVAGEDGIASGRGEDERCIGDLREVAAVGLVPARLLQRQVEIRTVESRRDEDAVQSLPGGVGAYGVPATITLLNRK